MIEAYLHARRSECKRACYVGNGDAMLRGLYFIHVDRQLGLRIFDVPVGIDHAGRLLEDGFDLLRDLRLAGKVGAVDLGHQRLKHRRTGRHFAQLNARSIFVANLDQARRSRLAMAWLCVYAAFSGKQVHLDVGLVGSAAQEVVAHQPVEVVRPEVPA